MHLIEQQIDRQGSDVPSASAGQTGQLGTSHITSADDKKLRVKHNILLAEYFNAKAKDPYGLRDKLIEQFEKSISAETVVGPPPVFTPVTVDKINVEEAKASEATDNQGLNLLISCLQPPKQPSSSPGTQAASLEKS